MRLRSLFAWIALSLSAALGLVAGPTAASAAVDIQVDLTGQRMYVTNGYGESYDWPVSTARFGYVTPRGRYRAVRMEQMHYSRKYHNSPMPHSIFFSGGYAIHGTYDVASLGRAASHGCVRLSPANAAALYQMVAAEGASITISGSAPSNTRYAGTRHERSRYAAARRGGYQQPGYEEELPAYPTAYAPAQQPSYGQWPAGLDSDN